MRLLQTSTFELKTFFDQGLPPYAILSHTWDDEEVTLQEVQQEESISLLQSMKTRIASGTSHDDPDIQNAKKGFLKIVGCALQAEVDGFEYIWMDTCCIDKT